MPGQPWIIYDTTNDTYLKTYDSSLASCTWGSDADAKQYDTKTDLLAAIVPWNDTTHRFIGKNPPPH